MELLTDPQMWIAFATPTALELVLGIDNIIFISILVDKLPRDKQELARRLGLFMAMFMRIGLLFVLSWIITDMKETFDLKVNNDSLNALKYLDSSFRISNDKVTCFRALR